MTRLLACLQLMKLHVDLPRKELREKLGEAALTFELGKLKEFLECHCIDIWPARALRLGLGKGNYSDWEWAPCQLKNDSQPTASQLLDDLRAGGEAYLESCWVVTVMDVADCGVVTSAAAGHAIAAVAQWSRPHV